MKTSLLVCLTWFLTTVTAYGTYGAWERILYYTTYLAEIDELGGHGSSDKQVMAKNCVADATYTNPDGKRLKACSFENFLKFVQYEYNPSLKPADSNNAAVRNEANRIKASWKEAKLPSAADQDNWHWALNKFQQTGGYDPPKVHSGINGIGGGANKIAKLFEFMADVMVNRADNAEPYRSSSLNAMQWVAGLREKAFQDSMIPGLKDKVEALGFERDQVVIKNEPFPENSRGDDADRTYAKWDDKATMREIQGNSPFDKKTTNSKLRELVQWANDYKMGNRSKNHFENQKAGRDSVSSIREGSTFRPAPGCG